MPGETKSENEDTEFISPLWIDATLIEKALRNEADKHIKVKDLTIVPATAAGDNYGSTIYRVKAALLDGSQRSLLIKALPQGETMTEWISQAQVFDKEGLLLQELIPKMEALLEEAAPGRFPPLAPRCPLQGKDPVDFIVMEDLCASDFKMAERKRGLGLRHSLLALRALARFHAASHALLRREPELIGRLLSVYNNADENLRQFMEGGIQVAADACRQWPGFESYADLLEKYKITSLKVITELLNPKQGDFNVIIHGDFWVNNMMFRYEDGQPADIRMVDLQMISVSSPAIDLHYFLSTSVSEDVSIHHEDLLVREYYFTLKTTLHILGLEAPSYESLAGALDSSGAYAVYGAVSIIPYIKADRPLDMEAAANGDMQSMAHVFESPLVRRWMQRALPLYQRRGWLPCAGAE